MKLDEARPDLLTRTSEGVLRITGTRVTLDSVVQAFQEGATPEEMCQDFPGLALVQVYSVLAFYLSQQNAFEIMGSGMTIDLFRCARGFHGRHRLQRGEDPRRWGQPADRTQIGCRNGNGPATKDPLLHRQGRRGTERPSRK